MIYYNLFVEETNTLYTYCDEREEFKIGDVVIVNFRNKEKTAVIVEKSQETSFDFKILPIKRHIESSISYSEEYIKLLLWVKKYYMTGYSHVFNLGNTDKVKVLYKKQYRYNRNYNPTTDLELELQKYFKKKDVITSSAFEKKYSKEIIENFLSSGIMIFETVVVEKKDDDDLDILPNDEIKIESRELSPEQLHVKTEIENSSDKYYLIKGITGSGKTEVYLSLIKDAFKNGQGSIFLVPEISLTPQMVNRFKEEFGDNVAILHSKMTPKNKQAQWEEIAKGQKKIVVGVRSAIFAPLKNIGYIIIDEEHEGTYKQDTNPRYHARSVALKRGEIEGCKVILGSATPSIESYYYAKQGAFKLLTMETRYNGATLPEIEVVDMKEENNEFFSKSLLKNIQETILKGEQVLLLLNRKGYSTYVQCKDCGHVEECEHCSIKYSYYQNEHRLKCNYCGTSKKYQDVCSKCGSDKIIHSGKGVERVYEELKKIFPVDIIRVDSEASKEKDFHSKMYQDFLDNKYKIMVGTQMITKGLHFPNVTLVGVINADMSMSFPDFRSIERTYQLLVQVSGRAGRGDKSGKVVIQTYQPEHHVFKDVANSDYETFYEREISDRRDLFYPPFSKLINIGISATSDEKLEAFAKVFYNKVKSNDVEVYGPMKSLVYKVKDRFRYNIFIKGNREGLLKYKKFLEEQLTEFETNKKYRIVVDVEPINLV